MDRLMSSKYDKACVSGAGTARRPCVGAYGGITDLVAWDVMEFLHYAAAAREATTHDVWRRVSAERPLALTTIATILSRLERKKVLEPRREGRQYVYWATVSRHDVRRSKIRDLVETLFDGNPAELVGHVVEGDGIDADGMQRLRMLLEDAVRLLAK